MKLHAQKEDLHIFYVTAKSFPQGIQEAFDTLEKKLPDASGRTLFGISKPDRGMIVYRAGALESYPGEGKAYGCETLVLKKGNYLTETVTGWKKRVEAISSVFEMLLSDPRLDPASYCVEWYQGEDVLCMVKIKD